MRNFNKETEMRNNQAAEKNYVPRTPHPLLVDKHNRKKKWREELGKKKKMICIVVFTEW